MHLDRWEFNRRQDGHQRNGASGRGKVDFNIHLEALNTESVTGTGQLSMNGPRGAMNATYAATAKWIGAACPKE